MLLFYSFRAFTCDQLGHSSFNFAKLFSKNVDPLRLRTHKMIGISRVL